MIRYFAKALGAHFRAGRSLFLLTVFGVALGVAAVLSIQIINRNALAAFEGGIHALSGDADLSVLGRTPSLPESLYVAVLATPGVQAAWPLHRVNVALAGHRRFYLEVIGVDLLAPLRVPWQGERADLAGALGRPGWAAFSPALAGEMGWTVGDSVQVYRGSQVAWLQVGALVDFQQLSPLASPRMVVMDIAQAQHLLGGAGQLHQIDVVVAKGADAAAVQARLQQALGPAVRVLTPQQRVQQTAGLLSAFRLNLTALSLISLIVGLFLVYSSTQASLVRRRAEFGMLRSLGATRAQVFGLIVAEVALLGGLGVLVGLPLGYWGARANIGVVSTALSNLYLLEEIHALELPWWLFGLAALIGVGGAVAGALMPALDMCRRDTRTLLSAFTLHEKIGSLAPALGVGGVLLMAVTGVWYWTLGRVWQPAGFALALSLLLGLPLTAPLVVKTLTGWIRVRNFGLAYSLRSLGTRLQTTAFAVAALAVAVSMVVGTTLMVGSFRRTLEVWIQTTVQADLYVSPASWRGQGEGGGLADELVATLAAHAGVRAVDRLRALTAYTPEDQRLALAAVDMGLSRGAARFALLQGEAGVAFDQVHRQGAVLIGETLARRKHLWQGDELAICVPAGVRSFPIAGVYYDYNAQGGAVIMDLATLAAHWGPGPVQSAALYLEPGLDAERVADALRDELGAAPLEIRSNQRLRREALDIFDQTFAVTKLLQGISWLIAVCGVALMLLVLAREQLPELALYRALGATSRQVFSLFVGKGLGMGLFGLVLGGAGGVLLAMILIFVINRAYFGWTIQLHWPWAVLATQAATILGAAVLASLYPAFKASRTPASELRREDA
ncbi:MAG: ABC transporter permease [Candidatus Latescibacteria bacterium]|nr:ABC transporter permease [Candidatus Latescibacterota bacterium]